MEKELKTKAKLWQRLKKARGNQPLFVLAPMADVTDPSFRRVIAEYGLPDAMWTEFVSADGLRLAPETGRKKLLRDLVFSDIERPIIAQFFSSNIESMYTAGKLAVELGFDGVDINMGCPVDAIEKQQAGAALIKNPERAKELVLALKKGVAEKAAELGVSEIDVSVKTRIGFNKVELETWLPALLETKPALITIHARTRKEMSKVPAQWEFVKRSVEIRDELQKDIPMEERTLIFGNGDVQTIEQGYARAKETGADGVMIGRGIFGNPWLFHRNTAGEFELYKPTLEEKLVALKKHLKYFDELLGDIKSFALMKKHFKSYVQDFEHAKDLRVQLMDTESIEGATSIIDSFLLSYGHGNKTNS